MYYTELGQAIGKDKNIVYVSKDKKRTWIPLHDFVKKVSATTEAQNYFIFIWEYTVICPLLFVVFKSFFTHVCVYLKTQPSEEPGQWDVNLSKPAAIVFILRGSAWHDNLSSVCLFLLFVRFSSNETNSLKQ